MELIISELNKKYPDFLVEIIPDQTLVHIIIYSPPKALKENLATNYYISKKAPVIKAKREIENIIEKIINGVNFGKDNNLK